MKLRKHRKRQQKLTKQKLINRYVRNPSLDYADTVYILTQPFYSLKHLEN